MRRCLNCRGRDHRRWPRPRRGVTARAMLGVNAARAARRHMFAAAAPSTRARRGGFTSRDDAGAAAAAAGARRLGTPSLVVHFGAAVGLEVWTPRGWRGAPRAAPAPPRSSLAPALAKALPGSRPRIQNFTAPRAGVARRPGVARLVSRALPAPTTRCRDWEEDGAPPRGDAFCEPRPDALMADVAATSDAPTYESWRARAGHRCPNVR